MTQEIVPKPISVPESEMLLGGEASQLRLLKSFNQGPELLVPDYLDSSADSMLLPSYEIQSPLGNRAHLVTLHEDNDTLEQFFNRSGRSEKARSRLANMTLEAVVRLMDTSGADGLHHIHNTVFPGTVYFSAKNGKGDQRNVYITNLGETDQDLPVIAFITATGSKKDEYRLFRALGAGSQKGRRNP